MIKFELITPEKVAVSEEIYEAVLPTEKGQIAVLPGHMALITLLVPGIIALRLRKNDADEKLEYLATSGGFVQIANNTVKVMADTAERADELDEARIEAARAEAQRMAQSAKDDVAYADAVARLEVELARQKVKNIKRRHGSHSRITDTMQ